jgi:hypothetical protein
MDGRIEGIVANAMYQDTSSDITLVYSAGDLGLAAMIVKFQNCGVL